MLVAWKESGWNILSKAMKYTTTITYRWALGWVMHLWGIRSYIYQIVDTCWEVRWARLGLGLAMCRDLRFWDKVERSTLVGMGGSWWEKRCLYLWSSFLALRGSDAWHFWHLWHQLALKGSSTHQSINFPWHFLPHPRDSHLDSIFICTSHILCYFHFVSHSIPTSFLFGFLFHFFTEFGLELYSIFSPCS